MQVNQLLDTLKNSKCKASKYSRSSCPYYKLNNDIRTYYKNNGILPENFCRELLDFKIPCKHETELYESCKLTSKFILFNDEDYHFLPYLYNNHAEFVLQNQLNRKDFKGFPLSIIDTRGLYSEYIVDNCLDKIKSPISEIFKTLIKHIHPFPY